MTLLFAVLAMACIASRYRICIAGAEERISAAWDTVSFHLGIPGVRWTYLAHEFGRLDFRTSGNNLTLTDTLGLGGHGQGVLEVIAKDDVLDKHGLNVDTPADGHFLDDFRC